MRERQYQRSEVSLGATGLCIPFSAGRQHNLAGDYTPALKCGNRSLHMDHSNPNGIC